MDPDRILRGARAILDPSFAAQPPFADFVRAHLPRFHRRPLLVPESTMRRLAHGGSDRAVRLVREMARANLARVLPMHGGENGLAPALDYLRSVGRLPKRLVVLSNDPNSVAEIEAVRGLREIAFAEFDRLRERLVVTASWFAPPRLGPFWLRWVRRRPPPLKPFLTAVIPAPPDDPLDARPDPVEGDQLRGEDGSRWRLEAPLGRGGEGDVFRVRRVSSRPQGEKAAKLFRSAFLTNDRLAKLQLMATRRLPDPTVCWPEAILSDDTGRWRGYLMPAAPESTVPLDRHLFLPDDFVRSQAGKGWTRRHSVQLAITLLSLADRLHRLNVLIGDVNPSNVLVADERTAYLVDCDSMQIESHPCPVGRDPYTPPELLAPARDFGTFLRTMEHERFALAVLVFQILMPGQMPYSRRGSRSPAEDVAEGYFPYATDEGDMPDVPPGCWRMAWSHLTPQLRGLFVRAFHRDWRSRDRAVVAQWLEALRDYRDRLADPAHTFLGPVRGFDLSLLPRDRYHDLDGGAQP